MPKLTTRKGNQSVTPSQVIPVSFNGVNHGLALPNYDVNELLPSDLFTDSSTLPRTNKATADSLVQSIEEKRQTLRVVTANIGLARDVVKAGTEYQRLQGDAITYGTELVNNSAKEVKYQTAGVNLNIEQSRLSQTQERLTQQGVALEGIQELTPLIREEWTQRVELQKSKVESIKLAVTSANAKLEADLDKVEQEAHNIYASHSKWIQEIKRTDDIGRFILDTLDLYHQIHDELASLKVRLRNSLTILDKRTTHSKKAGIADSVCFVVKQASHQNLGAIFIGQNANVTEYKGMSRSDWNSAVNLHIGNNAYDAITNSNQFTSEEQNRLKAIADKLTEFCTSKNDELQLDKTDPNAYRFALVIEPGKKPYFIELPAFGIYTYDQITPVAGVADSVASQPLPPTPNAVTLVNQGVASNVATGIALSCPSCGSSNAKKNGKTKTTQKYQCKDCGHNYAIPFN